MVRQEEVLLDQLLPVIKNRRKHRVEIADFAIHERKMRVSPQNLMRAAGRPPEDSSYPSYSKPLLPQSFQHTSDSWQAYSQTDRDPRRRRHLFATYKINDGGAVD